MGTDRRIGSDYWEAQRKQIIERIKAMDSGDVEVAYYPADDSYDWNQKRADVGHVEIKSGDWSFTIGIPYTILSDAANGDDAILHSDFYHYSINQFEWEDIVEGP